MRFLADENCDFAIVRLLRQAGHNVVAVAEIAPRASDSVVIGLASQEGRILLTEDRDFGQLVFAGIQTSGGVIYMRYPALARTSLAQDVLSIVERYGDANDTEAEALAKAEAAGVVFEWVPLS